MASMTWTGQNMLQQISLRGRARQTSASLNQVSVRKLMLQFWGSHYQRALLLEIYHGGWVTKAEEAVPWDQLMPVRMVTDYKSVSDTIRKESQSVGDRSSATNVAILRQLRITGCNPPGAKATLIWVPIKHQVADSLPKNGRHKKNQILETGTVTLHGISAKQHSKSRQISRQCQLKAAVSC